MSDIVDRELKVCLNCEEISYYVCESSNLCITCDNIEDIINTKKINMNRLKTKEKSDDITSYKNIRRCIKEIPLLYEHSNRFNKNLSGSYGMKHEIEKLRYDHDYISNGEFIVAMIYSNFKHKKSGQNCQFKYSKK